MTGPTFSDRIRRSQSSLSESLSALTYFTCISVKCVEAGIKVKFFSCYGGILTTPVGQVIGI